ncbi:hypothetical protein TARUN_7204 [Trichoderma arundinaceum]|uniref:Uncharacterized protein n=1 Tax=Trichoderma arundinaceum TaxID=490622 RepID=A0A395NGF8_TRIAR|nr:hypothetical protein TARUN_7204 [Trichoderma arundinaceum]
MTLVPTRASPASKLSSVGTEVIAYKEASGGPGTDADIISGASNWTGAKSTPPSGSPTPEETRLRRSGSMERQDGHQEVVQRVRSGARREAARERWVVKEDGERMLWSMHSWRTYGSKTWFLARLAGELDRRLRGEAKGFATAATTRRLGRMMDDPAG